MEINEDPNSTKFSGANEKQNEIKNKCYKTYLALRTNNNEDTELLESNSVYEVDRKISVKAEVQEEINEETNFNIGDFLMVQIEDTNKDEEFIKIRNEAISIQTDNNKHDCKRPFKCDICKKSFAAKYFLDSHKRLHTGEKPFKCEFCPMTFAAKGNLNTHRKKHTGEKTFKCEFCDKAFAQTSNLDNHRRIHTGQKPFKCENCHTSFATKSNLNRHKISHTGEIFKCELCNKSFTQKGHLHTHRKSNRCINTRLTIAK